MDIVTKRRIAEAIVTMQENTDAGLGCARGLALQVTMEGLDKELAVIMEAARCVQAIVSAYYGAGDLNVEMLARTIINLHAEQDKDKRFELPVLEGKGIGRWELVVRRLDREPKKRVYKPDLSKLM